MDSVCLYAHNIDIYKAARVLFNPNVMRCIRRQTIGCYACQAELRELMNPAD
jgi:hypothetical protein